MGGKDFEHDVGVFGLAGLLPKAIGLAVVALQAISRNVAGDA